MKARNKTTEIELDVQLVDKQARYIGSDGVTYWEEDLDFGIEDKNNPDYWTRLEHQYAGMAMQGLISSKRGLNIETDMYDIPYYSQMLAHALVEKLKESK